MGAECRTLPIVQPSSSTNRAANLLDRIHFFFDYVDPVSYAVEAALAQIGPNVGDVRVERIPFEVSPLESAQADPRSETWEARMSCARALAPGLDWGSRPVAAVPRSRKAIELAFHAAGQGAFDRVHRMLFEAHLSRGLDIGRVDVLVDLAVQAGLDRSETKAVLDVDRYGDDVVRWRDKGLALGVRQCPTVLAGSRRFEGLIDRASIDDLLEGV